LKFLFSVFSALNNIQFLNSEAFNGLTKLISVNLTKNLCIDQDFQDLNEVAKISKALIDKCCFIELKPRNIAIIATIAVVCSLSGIGIVIGFILYFKFCCKRNSTVAKARDSVVMVSPKV
jgi:hypothetical protein